MVWQSDPVLPLVLAVLAVDAVSAWLANKSVIRYAEQSPLCRGWMNTAVVVVFRVLVYGHGITETVVRLIHCARAMPFSRVTRSWRLRA